ncbi:hypothetical protein [Planctomyces sp. SH-PL62]|uniref:hypothetical protein n=1 Tax=Planctomyces sp. SH-PL62 TaxID=1636152 RepID=UPI000839606F|nr:hypothetical protein [Planctomyces sp. SH-PL62]
MANATAEKLKNFGLRFGDKFAVALASILFLVCLVTALKRPTIDVTPDQIKKAAEQSDSNLRRKVPTEEIVDTLAEQGLKTSDFAKEAEESSQMVLVAADFKPRREWVMPEPGAGLIRDQPVLIAPADVFAYPGRGGALIYPLDAEGKRIVETETKEPPKSATYTRNRRRGRRGGGMMGSGMMGSAGMMGMEGGMGMGMMGGAPRSPEEEKAQKAEIERRRREMQAKLAGKDAPAEEEPEDPGMKPQGPPPKEVTRGLRWVALTGTLDHEQMLENYRTALKNPAIAQPNYRRLDVQRQVKQKDGSWSDWADVAADRNLDILDNLPMEDEELAPETVRPENLVDPLPFLTNGLWEKVHIASLVPKELKEIPDPTATGGMMGPGGMMGGSGMMGSGMMGGMDSAMMGMQGGSGMMMGRGGSSSMMGMAGMMGMEGEMGMGMGSGMMMGGGGGATETLANFWRSEEKKVMVRALDFTAQPDESYRYRLRVVVYNPNLNREGDTAPGVDTKSEELQGPWSEPTAEVHMPPDVTAYAMGTLPAGPKSDMKVVFQVVKFNPEDGMILPRNFDASSGEIIGDPRSTPVPTSDGTGQKNKVVDFNSHLIVLDVAGGTKPLPSDFPGNIINQPAMALLLRPDGAVELRDEAEDRPNEVRKDVESNYKRELKESDKIRGSSMGSGSGMMGSGMMGSGMMGSGMMGGRR